MQIQLLKSKLHRARLTECRLDYEGSLGIDQDIMDAVGIVPGEKLLVVNQNNGERLETYAIPETCGSRTFCLNGAAARKGEPGDIVIVMAFASMTPDEARGFVPSVAVLDETNEIVERR